MASRGKKKMTMAKLNRETRLRERRQIKAADKQARKDARSEPLADVAQADLGEPALTSADSATTDA